MALHDPGGCAALSHPGGCAALPHPFRVSSSQHNMRLGLLQGGGSTHSSAWVTVDSNSNECAGWTRKGIHILSGSTCEALQSDIGVQR